MKITEEIMQQSLSLSAKTLSIINHILPDGLYFEEHVTWGWLRGYDNGDFEDGDNADNFMGWGPLGIFQMRYSGCCSVFYIELLLEDIDWEGGQNSNHIWLAFQPAVGFPTSGWKSTHGGWISNHLP